MFRILFDFFLLCPSCAHPSHDVGARETTSTACCGALQWFAFSLLIFALPFLALFSMPTALGLALDDGV
ncbi:hypothetical protein L6R29_06975 [Myxococcota bacterium]|nr:hypothetical protein [Myxococcota bacterium]